MTNHIGEATEKVIDLDALEKLADEATPGPWKIDRSYPNRLPGGISQDGTEGRAAITRFNAFAKPTQPFAERNAAFIAAANPATIKALIAELKEARKLLTRIDRVYADIQDGNGNHPTELRKVRAFLARNGKGEG